MRTLFTPSCAPLRGSSTAQLIKLHREDLQEVEQVSLVTGHKDWKMLRRYTHLKPEALHNARAREAA